MVSRYMIAPGPPVIASVCRTTSPSASRSSPEASASRCASVTAVKATKWIRLRASFIRVPAPSGPACTTFDPIRASTGPATSYAASEPPTMIARVPSAAPIGPPLTGASRTRTPSASSSAGVLGATVECTTSTGVAPEASTSAATLRTWSSSRTITQSTSTSATSVTEPAAVAPAATSSATGSGTTSCTRRSNSEASRSAIGLPMFPSPTKPTAS